MSKVKTIQRVSDLVPDSNNANKGTERGAEALENSLRKYGAGRSVLADKNGVLIAGNKTVEKAVELGIEDVVVVPTDGKTLVVVQRTDLDLAKDKAARELATVDNRVGQIDLDWDVEQLQKLKDEGIALADVGFFDADVNPGDWQEHWQSMPEYEQPEQKPTRTLFIHFTSEKHVQAFAKLIGHAITEKTKSIWFPKAPHDKTPKLYVGSKAK